MTIPRLGLLVLILACLALAGCAALDAATSPGPHGEPSLVSRIGGALSAFAPWAGTALTGLGAVYAALRARAHARAAQSMADGIEGAKAQLGVAGLKDVALGALVGALQGAQEAAGTREFVRKTYLGKTDKPEA